MKKRRLPANLSVKNVLRIAENYGYTHQIIRVNHFDGYLAIYSGISETPYPALICSDFATLRYLHKVVPLDR